MDLSIWIGWYPINRLNIVTFVYMSQTRMSYIVVLFMYNGLMWQVITRFTEIGEIYDDHWLNQLFHEVLNIAQKITEVSWLYIYQDFWTITKTVLNMYYMYILCI